MSDENPLLLSHEADGIKELDNLLPRWWVWLFYLTIAFAVVYMIYYHVLRAGDLQAAQFDREFKEGEKLKSAARAKFESSIATIEPAKDQVVGERSSNVHHPLRALSPGRRRRIGRTQPHGRLLDSTGQLCR